jgi:hypothetical protein
VSAARPGGSTLPAALEIACDESGFTGGNLTFPNAVFSHASVAIGAEEARAVIERLRRRTQARGELKAGWLLRRADRADLGWLLGTEGPVGSRAWVHLVDVRLFLLARLTDVLLGDGLVCGVDLPGGEPSTRESALLLRRDGEPVFGPGPWLRFLTLGGYALRSNSRLIPVTAVADFEDAVTELLRRPAPPPLRSLLRRLRAGTFRARAVRRSFEDDPRQTPLLEPLLPSLSRAVLHWGATARHLRVVHDEQSSLTPHRMADIGRALTRSDPGHTVEVVRVDSRDDPRVQVADLIAGVAQRAAAGATAGAADPQLVELVQPLVDPASVWPTSWAPDPRRPEWLRDPLGPGSALPA